MCLIGFLAAACLLLAVQVEHPKLPEPYSTPSVKQPPPRDPTPGRRNAQAS